MFCLIGTYTTTFLPVVLSIITRLSRGNSSLLSGVLTPPIGLVVKSPSYSSIPSLEYSSSLSILFPFCISYKVIKVLPAIAIGNVLIKSRKLIYILLNLKI